ncbi:hypothetical protein Ga0123461_1954 [Mariprofundus aestuarium]|uniref:Outer membrane protein beta-barrel domain-containing protein n=1 Tax=Mariprofundus aestuarium TaxID=1921086 RepID=A0A2K8KZA9_MARES|nr:hypothetical protein [Mariprofundus aestuarium]ATX80360.1 hypothetical protein Ga0123461_1954 [Mariprofundus aestuarium]
MKKMIATAVVGMGIVGAVTTAQAENLNFYTGLGLGAISVDYKAVGID